MKIIHRDSGTPQLDDRFNELDPDFCSLGQSVDYYRALAKLGSDLTAKILLPLQDALLDKEHGKTFQDLSSFKQSLLRESEAAAIWNNGEPSGEVVLSIKRTVEFKLVCRLPKATQDHEIDFQFGNGSGVPDRLIAFIGKNGTGKTQILRTLADAISTDAETVRIEPKRPGFTRVLTVSYSAFDHFKKPSIQRRGSYEYCGIYNDQGLLLSPAEQLQLTRDAVSTIVDLDRLPIWKQAIEQVLGDSGCRIIEMLLKPAADEPLVAENLLLSSGELLLLVAFSRIIAAIQPQSLLLLDEPELHLHPNAISGLVQVVAGLLESFNSHGVLATHSPLVLQQIPSKYVRVFGRSGNRPTVRRLQTETFGENLTVITEQIFFAQGEDAFYRRTLSQLSKGRTTEQVDALFERGLSLSAISYIESEKASEAESEG